MYSEFKSAKPHSLNGSLESLKPDFSWFYNDVNDFSLKRIPNYSGLKSLKPSDGSYWADLLKFEARNGSKRAFDTAKNRQLLNERQDFKQQRMEDASSNSTNEDYYGIIIDKMPAGFNAKSLFQYIRNNFSLATYTFSEFEAYNDSERVVWNSQHYFSAVMRFKTTFDDLSVITSIENDSFWIGTPVTSYVDQGHPLAGHRQFGLAEYVNGEVKYWVFYTRAIDRPFSWVDMLVQKLIFNGADTLWKTVMMSVGLIVSNMKGGHTADTIAFSRQVDWGKDVAANLKSSG